VSRGTLLLYLGNPIAGDDGIGIEVGSRLAAELSAASGSGAATRSTTAPRVVTAREFSGSPLDLLGAVEGYDRLILLDAVATGAPVGTVRLYDEGELMARRGDTYPHGLNLPEAIALGRRLQAILAEARRLLADLL